MLFSMTRGPGRLDNDKVSHKLSTIANKIRDANAEVRSRIHDGAQCTISEPYVLSATGKCRVAARAPSDKSSIVFAGTAKWLMPPLDASETAGVSMMTIRGEGRGSAGPGSKTIETSSRPRSAAGAAAVERLGGCIGCVSQSLQRTLLVAI